MTVLIVGASGYLGGEVAALASAAGRRVVGTFHRRPGEADIAWRRLDIADRGAVRELILAERPQVVINTAYRNDSWVACADGAASVALGAVAADARLVHVSSDAVHGGRPTPYADDDVPTPVNVYGAAKAAAETAVAAIDPAAVLIRTSLIIGDRRSKQISLALDLAAGRIRGALFTDEFRCPIAVDDLAAAVLELAAAEIAGTINVAGPEAISRADLGRLAAIRYGLDPASVRVCPIAEGGLGPRPADVRLDSTVATGLLTTRLRGVHQIMSDTDPARLS